MFDPKKIMDSAMDQVQKQATEIAKVKLLPEVLEVPR